MKLLHILAEYRNPFLNTMMLLLTQLGSSKILVIADIIIFWCLDKEAGFFLLNTSGISVFVNQMLKSVVRIQRPWILDENFSAVEAAKKDAGGFSFPSGHSQNTGLHMTAYARLYGGKKAVKVLTLLLIVLIPFSRMFLGVHTPLDVGVGLFCGIFVFLLFYELHYRKKHNRACHLLAVALTFVQLLYFRFFLTSADPNDVEALESAVTIFALMLGIWISYEMDRKYLRFETKGSVKKQIMKVFLGLPVFLIIVFGLLYGLQALGLHRYFAVFIGYFLGCLFAGCIWPYLFSKPGFPQ